MSLEALEDRIALESLINKESELAVIGTFVTDKRSHNRIEDIDSSIFSDLMSRELFKIIKNSIVEGLEIDIPLLVERIKLSNIRISSESLVNLTLYSNYYTLDQNIKLLQDLYIKRSLFERAGSLRDGILNGQDIEKLIYDFEEGSKKINKDDIYDDHIESIARRLFDSLERGEEKGFKFGVPILDKVIGGVFKGELITIGAKSGVGKTAMALSIVQEAIKQDKTVLVITREMTDEHITQRLITQQTGVSSKTMKTKTMTGEDWVKIVESLGYLGKTKLYINHDISKPSQIRKRVRQLKPDLVVIDYLQLLTSEKTGIGREQEVAYLSREMKKITTEFKTAVVQLTQLNESFKGRPMGESAVRESRAIFHDSNAVVYLHKPVEYDELYELSNKDENLAKTWHDMNLNSPTKIYEVIVAKSRDSGTAVEKMWYIGNRLSFKPFEK